MKILKFIGMSLCYLIVIIVAIVLYLRSSDWKSISTKTSPSGEYQAQDYLSGAHGLGQAPYGDHIVLSRSNTFPWNNQEETVFAGYCKRDIEYKWEGNKRIVVWCEGKTRYKVLSSQYYGVGIDIFYHKRK